MPKKFDPTTDVPDLSGKVILITGGNAGIGAATVRALTSHNPKCIYVCSRKISNGEQLVESIHKQHPAANVRVLQLDLNDFASVKKCAAEFNGQSDRLDMLFLNAGICTTSPALTKQGYESQFGINHMGHALLTQFLLPTMLNTAKDGSDVRILLTSSKGATVMCPKTGLVLDQMKTKAEGMPSWIRYGHSKLANAMFAKKLAQLFPSITSVSIHPGTVKSEIWNKPEVAPWIKALMSPIVWWQGLSNEEGAKTGLWCATAPAGEGKVENGKFYWPIGVPKEDDKNLNDQKLVDELWQWTTDELAAHDGPGWPKA